MRVVLEPSLVEHEFEVDLLENMIFKKTKILKKTKNKKSTVSSLLIDDRIDFHLELVYQ
jgi:hypothetical protein